MKRLAGYLNDFARATDKKSLLLIAVLTTLAVIINYSFQLEHRMLSAGNHFASFVSFFGLYLIVFAGSYILLPGWKIKVRQKNAGMFISLLLIVPALFALRVSSGTISSFVKQFVSGDWGRYLAVILNAPLKCVLLLIIVQWIKSRGHYEESLTGLQQGSINYLPFFAGVAIFLPVIMIVASQPDFLRTYPKFKRISFIFDNVSQPWITAVFYELSYAFDFVFTEVFFRGLLVFAFIRFAGPAAILPMASLYCAIHFGKPLAECISSFFGGILLGVISYRTRSVMGGLVLHLGIGWLMELVAWIMQ